MQTQTISGTRMKTIDMVYSALFAVLIAVCAWITVPMGHVPFTMQTFGVFCTLGMLGGKRGTLSVLVYILLGAVGAPVFSGFGGGLGVLLNTTGGYIIGFLAAALLYWGVTALCGKKLWSMALGMLLGLVGCYAFGTLWFVAVYARTSGAIGVGVALGKCVVPYILPDLCKIALALFLSKLLRRHVPAFK